jgi:flagellar basal body P-ring formation protein FlgA
MRALLAFLLLIALPAHAAMLRPLTTLDGDVVHLSDLFDGAGSGAARVLGPAPAPGGRIVVAAPQLAAIARQFGIDWTPPSPSARAVLERLGRAMPRETLMRALRTALAGAGAGEDLDIDLGAFTAPMIPPGATAEANVEQLDWDAASGRFTGLLAINADGMTPQRLRVSGIAQEMATLPVPVRRLNPGHVVRAEDLRLARVRAGLAGGEVVHAQVEAIGMTLRRQAIAGQPITTGDLQPTPMVAKRARVTMRLSAPGLSLVAMGQALDAGSQGEQIRVVNIASHAVVAALVVGPDEVRVLPGSQPLSPADRRAAPLAWNTP